MPKSFVFVLLSYLFFSAARAEEVVVIQHDTHYFSVSLFKDSSELANFSKGDLTKLPNGRFDYEFRLNLSSKTDDTVIATDTIKDPVAILSKAARFNRMLLFAKENKMSVYIKSVSKEFEVVGPESPNFSDWVRIDRERAFLSLSLTLNQILLVQLYLKEKDRFILIGLQKIQLPQNTDEASHKRDLLVRYFQRELSNTKAIFVETNPGENNDHFMFFSPN